MPRKPRPARRADVCPAWSRAALVAVRLHFAARNRAGRLPAPQGPLFCRPRHGCAAPGPQRQKPGACRASFALHFACGETALAGHRPHRGRYFAVPVTAAPRRGPNGKTPALVAVRLHFACAKPRGRTFPPPGATCSLPHFRFAQMWPRIFPRGLPGYVPLFHGWPRARTPAQAAAAASAPAVFAAAETVSSATRAAAAPRRMARMKCPARFRPARRQAAYISPPRLFSFVFSFSFFPPFLTMGSLLRQRPPRISSRRQNRQPF